MKNCSKRTSLIIPFIPPCSLMFWTNWNEQSPSIMRATLTGANVLVIIGSDIRTPNGLAIDHRAEKLYFSDATLDKIERCEYDGSRRYVSNTRTLMRTNTLKQSNTSGTKYLCCRSYLVFCIDLIAGICACPFKFCCVGGIS